MCSSTVIDYFKKLESTADRVSTADIKIHSFIVFNGICMDLFFTSFVDNGVSKKMEIKISPFDEYEWEEKHENYIEFWNLVLGIFSNFNKYLDNNLISETDFNDTGHFYLERDDFDFQISAQYGMATYTSKGRE